MTLRGPLQLIRRMWVVPYGVGRLVPEPPDSTNVEAVVDDGEERSEERRGWATLPALHIIVERSGDHGSEFRMEICGDHGDRQIVNVERNHPAFPDWLDNLIEALKAARDEECTVEAWACEERSRQKGWLPGRDGRDEPE